ncbi:MAG: hypothetical protein OEY86_17385 [Nitrospira sp.]|nr:hypothetical protein [Nitrospira sp.]
MVSNLLDASIVMGFLLVVFLFSHWVITVFMLKKAVIPARQTGYPRRKKPR